MKISSVFSYYGGKSKIVNCYPPAKYLPIIEPFAGAAAYAWRHADCDVWINDIDPRTYSIWRFLISPDALDWIEQYIPVSIEKGTRISDLLPAGAPIGLLALMQAEANRGTQGAKGVHNQVTSIGAACWCRFLPKMREVIPRIAHWRVTNHSYSALPNEKATWFIDPPYSNKAGTRYRQMSVNYELLAGWCRTRLGQVIVCENLGASWLPFEPIKHRQISIKSRYQHANTQEVMWHSE